MPAPDVGQMRDVVGAGEGGGGHAGSLDWRGKAKSSRRHDREVTRPAVAAKRTVSYRHKTASC